MGKKDSTKDTIKDNQVNSNFPYRWSPASLTFYIYFYLFLYLYITRRTIDNNTPHLNLPKNQNRRAALGLPEIKLLGKGVGGGGAGASLISLRSTRTDCNNEIPEQKKLTVKPR